MDCRRGALVRESNGHPAPKTQGARLFWSFVAETKHNLSVPHSVFSYQTAAETRDHSVAHPSMSRHAATTAPRAQPGRSPASHRYFAVERPASPPKDGHRGRGGRARHMFDVGRGRRRFWRGDGRAIHSEGGRGRAAGGRVVYCERRADLKAAAAARSVGGSSWSRVVLFELF